MSVYLLCSTQIYEQVMDVVERLYNVSALRVVGLICDGASEHSKFFRIVLDGAATTDPTRTVYMGHPCDECTKVFSISDVPHITKKGRGSLLRSGLNSWSTRRMLFGKLNDTIHDGHLITWDPLIWIHEERNKKNAAGQQRLFRLLMKLTDAAIYPTSLELLRVCLAATVFSPEVRDLIDQYKDDLSRKLLIDDLDPLLTYMSHFWELLQLNNSVGIYIDLFFCYIHHRLSPTTCVLLSM